MTPKNSQKENGRRENQNKMIRGRLRKMTGVFRILPVCLILFLCTGCAQLNVIAVQTGLKENPYYQLGDTWWDHGGIEEYYFNQIPSRMNEIYRELYERIRNYEDEASLYATVGEDLFWDAYYAVMADHPEFFWVGSNVQAQQAALTGEIVGYKLSTTVPVSDRDGMKARLEAAADECIASIPQGASEYEKIKYVYEYLITHTEYNVSAADNQNIQSVLLGHASVCAGYSRTFQYILHRMGMFCTYVTGKISTGGDHAWNIVRIGGQYYNVDVTWGDPVFIGEEGGERPRSMNYNYLCCTDRELYRTHVPEASVPLPECTDDSYNYYRLHGQYYESFDYDAVYQALMNSVWSESGSVVFKFADRTGYDTAMYEFFSNGMLQDAARYLMDVYQTSSWNYSYHADDDFFLITIYW